MSNQEQAEKKGEDSSEEDFDTFLDNCAAEMKTMMPEQTAKTSLFDNKE